MHYNEEFPHFTGGGTHKEIEEKEANNQKGTESKVILLQMQKDSDVYRFL